MVAAPARWLCCGIDQRAARAALAEMIRMPEPTPNTVPSRDSRRLNQPSPRVILPTLAVLAAGLVLLGCGLEGQPYDTDKEGNSDPVVSGDDISAEEAGSARRTVLEWWRGVQTRNPDAVVGSYTADVQGELPETYEFVVVAVVAPSAAQSSITIGPLEMNGSNKATLLATIDSPNNAVMTGPLALPMEKVGDKWLIASDAFLKSLAGSAAVENALKKTDPPPSKAKEPSGG